MYVRKKVRDEIAWSFAHHVQILDEGAVGGVNGLSAIDDLCLNRDAVLSLSSTLTVNIG